MRKAEGEGKTARIDDGVELSAKEVRLVKLLASYPAKVKEAADSLSPALLANYSYELAKEFNQYYHDTPILKETDSNLLSMRLSLIGEVAEVLEKAMGLLGISLPDRM